MRTHRNPSEIAKSGDWEADNHAGRDLAAAILCEARATGNPITLTAALRDVAAARGGGEALKLASPLPWQVS